MGNKQIVSPYDFFADEYPGVNDAIRGVVGDIPKKSLMGSNR